MFGEFYLSLVFMAVGGLLPLPASAQPPAVCYGGGDSELSCWFHQGLQLEEGGFLEQAVAAYERALALDPERGSVLNNLAGVYAARGDGARAESLFKRAIERDQDPLQPFYRRNFGDLLASLGDWSRAADQYRKALEEAPEDLRAHESLVALYTQHRPGELPGYLRFLLDRGQVIWAEEVALSRLESTPTEEYLSLLAEARAGQTTPPDQLLPQAVVDILQSLTGHPEVGEGAQDLLLLREGGDFDPASFSWWAERPGSRQAFRSLARSFGDSQRQAERVASAGDYYRLAVLLTPEEPDLVSFRRMLDLPSATEDVQAVDPLAVWNERSLRKSRPARAEVYRYRHDLGLHYASLGKWKDCRCPTSGVYQLEKAVALADVAGPPDGDPPFDARIYIRLAELYLAAGRPEMATRALRSLAGAYGDQGMGAEAGILTLTLPFETGAGTAPDITRSMTDVSSDPLVPLRDFTTEPPRPPSP